MKRIYAHYTLFYPFLFLKNNVIELDENNCLIAYYPFSYELQNTEFYSGLLVFSIESNQPDLSFIKNCWNRNEIETLNSLVDANPDFSVLKIKQLEMNHFD